MTGCLLVQKKSTSSEEKHHSFSSKYLFSVFHNKYFVQNLLMKYKLKMGIVKEKQILKNLCLALFQKQVTPFFNKFAF